MHRDDSCGCTRWGAQIGVQRGDGGVQGVRAPGSATVTRRSLSTVGSLSVTQVLPVKGHCQAGWAGAWDQRISESPAPRQHQDGCHVGPQAAQPLSGESLGPHSLPTRARCLLWTQVQGVLCPGAQRAAQEEAGVLVPHRPFAHLGLGGGRGPAPQSSSAQAKACQWGGQSPLPGLWLGRKSL